MEMVPPVGGTCWRRSGLEEADSVVATDLPPLGVMVAPQRV